MAITRTPLVVRTHLYHYDYHPEETLAWERARFAEIGADYRYVPSEGPSAIVAACGQADAVLGAARGMEITREVVGALQRCRILVTCSVGYERIDLGAATARGIIVANLPDVYVPEVADHALAMILACLRKLPQLTAWVKGGHWEGAPLRGIPRFGRVTLGLLAFGNIAQKVARRALACDMRVVAYDPYADPACARELGVTLLHLDELLQCADVISCHLPLTTETRGMLGPREFGLMKPGVIFVNTGRGAVVQEAALIRALAEGRVAAAGLDVFEREPPAGSALLTMENVLASPHIAGYCDEVAREISEKSVGEARRVLTGRWPRAIAFRNPELRARLSLTD